MPWRQIIGIADYLEQLNAAIANIIDESKIEGLTFQLVGLVPIAAKVLIVMLSSTINSYIIAFILVGLLMFLLMGGVSMTGGAS